MPLAGALGRGDGAFRSEARNDRRRTRAGAVRPAPPYGRAKPHGGFCVLPVAEGAGGARLRYGVGMYFIIRSDQRPGGFVNLSNSNDWVGWLGRNIPMALAAEVRERLKSNLKHLLVNLELKTALIEPHARRGHANPSALFEPYFQGFIMEFGVGAFSVLEGLGAAHWLAANGHDGAAPLKIGRGEWRAALNAVYDPDGDHGLDEAVGRTLAVRDLLHQDKLGAREAIDWHAMTYDAAFRPASKAIRTLLLRETGSVPPRTNLSKGD
jgi:hypothetical protein